MTKRVLSVNPDRKARLVVLISGEGSNMKSLVSACTDPLFCAEVVGVVSDRASATGLEWAAGQGISTACLPLEDYTSRENWDAALTEAVTLLQPDLVVSAGFLKILGPNFLAAFPDHILNTHNSLLPSFAGIHGPRDALRAGVKLAGATLFIVDPGMDTGPILAQVAVPVKDEDTVETLTARIKTAERAQLVEVVGKMVKNGWWIEGLRAGL